MSSTVKQEVVVQRGNVHPVLKGLIWLCMLLPTVSTVLMAIGAWDVHGDRLDGALTSAAVLSGVIGTILIFLLDRVD